MRRTIISGLLLACFVCIAPVAAQTSPAPEPTVSVSLDTLNRAVEVLERLSSSNTNTVNAAVLLQGIINLVIFGGGLLFVWRGGLKPLHETITSDRARATKAEAEEERVRVAAAADKQLQDGLRLKQAEALQTTAQELGKVATIMSEAEENAKRRTTTAVSEVNTHTDGAHLETRREIAELRKEVTAVTTALERVERRLGSKGEDDTADLSLSSALTMLRHIEQRLDQLGTGPLDPSKVPDHDPALTDGKSTNDVWSGDHPPNLPPEQP